jgi:hypothetical protein
MNTLQQEIEGTNKINLLALSEINKIQPQLLNFIGEKILIGNGKTSSKFIIEFTKNVKHSYYFDISAYSIWLKISTSIKVGEFSYAYFDKSIYMGEMCQDGKLKNILPIAEIINNWNLDKKETLRNAKKQIAKYKKLKSEIEKIEANFKLSKDLLKY